MSNVAIITGAGSGFGLGLAKELTNRGWVVYATDRDSVALEKAKEFGAIARRMNRPNGRQCRLRKLLLGGGNHP